MAKLKLAIVDDELTSRNTIKNYLKDSEEYEVVADFSDGRSALDWLRENEVDIFLCDMQMPGMNGVEFMRLVHIVNEFLPVIAVSGFDNFDYVRGSLINGASNYLLKHELTRENLRATLDQVREKYRIVPRENSVCRRTGYCIRDGKEFTGNHIRQLVDEGRIAFSCTNVVPLAVSPDYRFPENILPAEYKQGILSAVTDILAQILGQEASYLLHVTGRDHLIILISFSDVKSSLYMINTLKNIALRLQKQIIRLLDLTCTILMGEVHLDLDKAVREGREMETCLEDKLYLGCNRTVPFAVHTRVHYGTEKLPQGLWKQLEFEEQNQVAGEVETIGKCFDFMEEKRFPREKVVDISRRMAQLIGGEKEDGKKLLRRLGEYEIFGEFRNEILELYHRTRVEKTEQKSGYSAVVSRALEYIEQNYCREISLESCAEATGSGYTYLSRAFRQETGMRFVEYLNQCRIGKAKSLLIRKELSMKEIVEVAGFRNYNYFFKVFKESEGVTPSEFTAKN